MNKYEYKVISERYKFKPTEDVDKHLEARLNYWGELGWHIFKLETKVVDVEEYSVLEAKMEVVGVDLYISAVAARKLQHKEDFNWSADKQCL